MTIDARAPFAQQIIKITTQQNFFISLENSPLDGTVHSGQINFEINHILIQFPKSPVRPASSECCQAPTVENLNKH